jgi:hypothetical protein
LPEHIDRPLIEAIEHAAHAIALDGHPRGGGCRPRPNARRTMTSLAMTGVPNGMSAASTA